MHKLSIVLNVANLNSSFVFISEMWDAVKNYLLTLCAGGRSLTRITDKKFLGLFRSGARTQFEQDTKDTEDTEQDTEKDTENTEEDTEQDTEQDTEDTEQEYNLNKNNSLR